MDMDLHQSIGLDRDRDLDMDLNRDLGSGVNRDLDLGMDLARGMDKETAGAVSESLPCSFSSHRPTLLVLVRSSCPCPARSRPIVRSMSSFSSACPVHALLVLVPVSCPCPARPCPLVPSMPSFSSPIPVPGRSLPLIISSLSVRAPLHSAGSVEDGMPLDTRPLAERLAEAKALKRETHEEALKFSTCPLEPPSLALPPAHTHTPHAHTPPHALIHTHTRRDLLTPKHTSLRARAVGNLIKKVDDDESSFLDDVARDHAEMERTLRELVSSEVMQFRSRQVSVADSAAPDLRLLKPEHKPVGVPKRDLQRDILSSGIVRKKSRSGDEPAVASAVPDASSKKAAASPAGKAAAPSPPKATTAPPKATPPKATAPPKALGLGLDYGSGGDDDDDDDNGSAR